ncbi:4-hydroxy-tetrahydrodipicolinate synthase [Rhizobiales bacterium GAS188]|nr:4-hydroxy-tetrahydrodipicolinate synthase [Rhizobiales bacterium GAS188]
MTRAKTPFGLSCALSTPFRPDGQVALNILVGHARWCLAQGCDSVTAFGTTGEGASLGLASRELVLGALASAGLEPRRELVGCVASASLEEALAQARQILDADGRALLLAPPFYFKAPNDDGVFAWFAKLFERLGAQARDVILYNIPSVTQVELSVDLVSRLRKSFPEVIIGVKDSSGDFDYTERLLARHRDISILIGDERCLAAAMRLGGEGSICGLANLCPERIGAMIRNRADDEKVVELVDALVQYPVIPAVKALVAHRSGDPGWLAVQPPLTAMAPAEAARLAAAHDAIFAARAA